MGVSVGFKAAAPALGVFTPLLVAAGAPFFSSGLGVFWPDLAAGCDLSEVVAAPLAGAAASFFPVAAAGAPFVEVGTPGLAGDLPTCAVSLADTGVFSVVFPALVGA